MRKTIMFILAAAMTFVTACSSSEDSDKADSTITQTSLTSGTSVSDNTFANTSSTAESNQESEPSTDKEENTLCIKITISGRTFSATLYDNETAREFKERLPITLDMSELNGNEKYYYLPDSLPTDSSRPSGINSGDIMLYGSDCLVIFYESFSTSYSYTPVGKIDNPDGLASALGKGSVQVAFS